MAGTKKKASKSGLSGDQLLAKLKPVLSTQQKLPIAKLLASAGVASPLVLVSEQHLRVKRLVNWLRENLIDDATGGFASYFGSDLSTAHQADHIRNDLTSLSLFTRNQLLVVYDTEKIKAPSQKSIIEALERATDSALLVLCAPSINQRSPLLVHAAEHGTVIELSELSGATLDKWIEKEVLRAGIVRGIQPDAKALLVECYGGDVSRLASEIEKLCLLSVPGEKIGKALVEAISSKSPEVTSFELVRQLAAKNPLRAVSLANDLIAQGLHPLQVNSFLSRAFRVLLANKESGGARLHPDLSNPWFLKQLGSTLRHFSVSELGRAVTRLTRLDFQLKDSNLPASLALTIAMQEIAVRRA